MLPICKLYNPRMLCLQIGNIGSISDKLDKLENKNSNFL
jgi:hypothetical protein